jgi:hypothetical protein
MSTSPTCRRRRVGVVRASSLMWTHRQQRCGARGAVSVRTLAHTTHHQHVHAHINSTHAHLPCAADGADTSDDSEPALASDDAWGLSRSCRAHA